MSLPGGPAEQESLEGEVGDGAAAPWLNIRYIWTWGRGGGGVADKTANAAGGQMKGEGTGGGRH